MKTLLLLPAILVAACLSAAAQAPAPTILERGPYHRRLQTVRDALQPDGSMGRLTNSYVEFAVHYQKDGQWVEAVEQIEPFPDGAVARQGPHQVIFPPSLQTPIDLLAPDGNRFRIQVLGLSYFDSATQSNLLIAEINGSLGQIQAPNQVIYPATFKAPGEGEATHVKADVRYTYTKFGLEQDVILRETDSLPSPADYGLNPQTTRLEIYSEFLASPVPEQKTRLLPSGLVDTDLTFGAAKIGRGTAFSLGDQKGPRTGIPVQKIWQRIDGRDWLIESISYPEIKAQIDALPKGQAAVPKARRTHMATAQGRQIPSPTQAVSMKRPLQMASVRPPAKGLVLDYTILFPITSWTNKANETYYVSTNVAITYLTVEGLSVTKYAVETSIDILGDIDCRTAPYRMASFTGKDDDSLGASIDGSTGNPYATYADAALILHDEIYEHHLSHLRFAYAGVAIDQQDGALILRHCQILHGSYGLHTSGYSQSSLENVLFYDLYTALWGTASVQGQHLTFNKCYNLTYGNVPSVCLTNSLLADVTRWTNGGTASFYTNAVVSVTASSALQTVGAGCSYLAPNSPYHQAGVTNISPTLLSELRTLTTYPPVVLSNVVSTDLTLSPQAPRDTGAPDIGAHYDPIDYAVSSLAVTNAKLTLTGGVVLATFGGMGLLLQNGSQLISEGSPLARNHICHYTCVQENTTNWMGEACSHQTLVPQGSTSLPSAQLRFTDFEGPSCFGWFWYNSGSTYAWNAFRARDCAFRVGSIWTRDPTNSMLALTNNLFERLSFYDWGPAGLACQNNLFTGADCLFTNASTNVWTFHDNVFDGCTLSSSALTNTHTAYINMTNRLTPTNSSDKVLSSLAWQTGPLGCYYQPTNSVLLDAGSTYATNVGLAHWTVTPDQVKDTGLVDIGMHYVALTNGVPWDSDVDGLADYWEDGNGNAIADAGELNWQAPDTDGDGMSDLLELLQGRNPLDPDSGPENGTVNLRVFTPLK